MKFIPAELIHKKKSGQAHPRDEIQWIIKSYSEGTIPDYQMAAWAMAVWFRGMAREEISALTEAMRDSGARFDFSSLKAPRLDKHSTGGVGDKTSLIIGPIMAAAGVHTPMIAGRGLGHTGGTLDKLESIPGFRVSLSKAEFQKHVKEKFFAIMGQTEDICPADRKLYALRDVTSTVDSLPLICGSIMSKKLCEDLTGLVLDVKFGSGAFMKTLEDARKLATLLIQTGVSHELKVVALLSDMNQPLGRFAGNALEVTECLEILEGKTHTEHGFDFYSPTRELSVQLSGHMLALAGKANDPAQGCALASELLSSGKALRAFHDLLEYQGPADITSLPVARHKHIFAAKEAGYLNRIDVEKVGWAAVTLGAGRFRSEDRIDHTAGIEFVSRLGERVEKGQPLAVLFADSESRFTAADEILQEAYSIERDPSKSSLPLVAEVLT